MKEHVQIPQDHYSYAEHRRQFWLKIFLPVILTTLLIIAAAVITGVAAFSANDNSSIWAAVSTIWLLVPVLVFGLAFMIILVALIYLLARTLKIIPPYSANAQYHLNRAVSEIKRFSDMAAKPVLFLEGLKASLKAFFGRI